MPNLSKAEQKRLIAALKKRKADNKGKQINNSSLYAGSPMYYYCRHCGVLTDTLAESDFSTRPRQICSACREMVKFGYSFNHGRFLEFED